MKTFAAALIVVCLCLVAAKTQTQSRLDRAEDRIELLERHAEINSRSISDLFKINKTQEKLFQSILIQQRNFNRIIFGR